ncbi:cytochrome P450 [Rubrivivax albus]|uniref:Cytochrome P450 n=1 Tax=Rubrivivax albus TaxID=2499835 RepID=A0A3S2U2N8_9BURK|nr:cytochrome P450 [Rubrivivax albus]RVT51294.1 cytochrome P450 [Rubrivivax albus]
MTAADLTDIDLQSDAFRQDPYTAYARMRAAGRLVQVNVAGQPQWMATRHADIAAALKDARFGTESELPSAQWLQAVPEPIRVLHEMQRRWMLFLNPPTHTRLRGLAHQAFTPRMVQALEGQIEQRAHELLDRALAQPVFDLVHDFAHPLPVDVIAQILGVPIADREAFARWSVQLGATLDPIAPDEVYLRGGEAAMGFSAYMRQLIAQRRGEPGSDLLSALIAAEQAGDHLDEEEMIATCVLLLLAGHETTQNLIGNGVHALLRHPEQLLRLRQEPQLIKSAVEEMLRYDSPVQCVPRLLREDMAVGGVDLPRNSRVWMLIGSAHRDEEAYPNASVLDIGRDRSHLAFGAGIHFCLGALLARTEAQIALRVLLERAPNLRLAGGADPRVRPMVTLRGLQSLPVAP